MATTTMTHPSSGTHPSSTVPTTLTGVIGGVDTHRDTHTAAALDTTGHLHGSATFPATTAGYHQLLTWLRAFGPLEAIGVEGTGAYGAGLARYLHSQAITVYEVNRPSRRTRRTRGKSDPIDAESAARAALARDTDRISTPKHSTGATEAVRALRVARRSAVQARTIIQHQIHALLVNAPEQVRAPLHGLPMSRLISTAAADDPAALTPPAGQGDPAAATRLALHHLARRYQHLAGEIAELDTVITGLLEQINPALTALLGVGPDCAGQLLITAGDNPDRLRSQASFAHLCGVAPIPASSGLTHRHRLNRGGDRQANAALYRIVLTRLRFDQRTRDYLARRTGEGLSKKDVIRCLKRYVAREVYTALTGTNIAQSGT